MRATAVAVAAGEIAVGVAVMTGKNVAVGVEVITGKNVAVGVNVAPAAAVTVGVGLGNGEVGAGPGVNVGVIAGRHTVKLTASTTIQVRPPEPSLNTEKVRSTVLPMAWFSERRTN